MLVLNEKTYSKEYVEKAIEAFSQTEEGREDTYQDQEYGIGLTYKSDLGDVLISLRGYEYHPVTIDLISTPDQQEQLKVQPNLSLNLPYKFLPIAEIDFPEAGADLLPVEGKVANCPQIYLYEKFSEDASHAIFMDGDGLLIREI